MCSVNTGQCPTSTVSGYQFSSHYDCVNAGYAIAQKTFRNLNNINNDLSTNNQNLPLVSNDTEDIIKYLNNDENSNKKKYTSKNHHHLYLLFLKIYH